MRRLSETKALGGLTRFLQRSIASAEPVSHLFHRAYPIRMVPAKDASLTIMSANLWHDWPRHRQLQERLEAFARLVEEQQADLVLLQEVARNGEIQADEWLANRLGMSYTYARANGNTEPGSFEEGLAILSRFPLVQPRVRPLPQVPWPFVHRLALAATVRTPFGSFLAVSAHLGHGRREGRAQVTDLRNWVGELAGTGMAIIGGDFNAAENTKRVRWLKQEWQDLYRQAQPEADGITYELRLPWGTNLLRRRLDYLFLQPGEQQWWVEDARHLFAPQLAHSDHRAVLVRLTAEP
jgi:endonuclease/exonuclease/phosphatase family metal-dependent hydrolase